MDDEQAAPSQCPVDESPQASPSLPPTSTVMTSPPTPSSSSQSPPSKDPATTTNSSTNTHKRSSSSDKDAVPPAQNKRVRIRVPPVVTIAPRGSEMLATKYTKMWIHMKRYINSKHYSIPPALLTCYPPVPMASSFGPKTTRGRQAALQTHSQQAVPSTSGISSPTPATLSSLNTFIPPGLGTDKGRAVMMMNNRSLHKVEISKIGKVAIKQSALPFSAHFMQLPAPPTQK
eukprot:TRINITY_DN11064_c0_g1_i1.p1 TRINITY_DN11064_c0_g1~~TRINITY_DN11064_c0_g1_i1.p1  ORF type:complete len:231 (-),score=53.04 TRINITY_DN11064_c0_g1_i1:19-711(-)